MTKIEVEASSSVILGEIFIYNISLHALIDSNTTHSFVSLAYVEKLDNQSKALDVIYCIVISSSDIMYSGQKLRSYLIQITYKELIINLIILNI